MIVAETFMELMKDPNHWGFEIVGMIIFDGLLGALAWPMVKRWVAKHDQEKHS